MLPILWDRRTNQIVNNESSEIVHMYNSNFNRQAQNKTDSPVDILVTSSPKSHGDRVEDPDL